MRRLELRLRPLNSPVEYLQFLRRWERVEKALDIDKRVCDIRFAIHFKRSLGSHSAEAGDQNTDFHSHPMGKFVQMLDRDTAVLHAFRMKVPSRWRHLASRIARIDFAGQERDIPPERAAFSMKLVRGEPDAIAALERGNFDEKFHRSWLHLLSKNQAHQPLNALNLGMTCHAGEDFAHPLEGMYCISSAVRALTLRPGDTIGHGLAAGADLQVFRFRRGGNTLTQKGIQFDALVWLHTNMMRYGTEQFGAISRRLEDLLWEIAAAIYGREALPPTLYFFERLTRERGGPIPTENSIQGAEKRNQLHKEVYQISSDRNQEIVHMLKAMEIWDEKCRRMREARVPLVDLYPELENAITWLQHRLLEEIARKGIVLEFNPSSNWRVSGAEKVTEVPFARILQFFKGSVLATLNTDNPGIFNTRIENEYAIALDALLELGTSRTHAFEILGRLRKVGLENIYWPRRFDNSVNEAKNEQKGYRWNNHGLTIESSSDKDLAGRQKFPREPESSA